MSTHLTMREADFTRLMERHHRSVWRYLRFLGAEPSLADDLTQETFLSLLRTSFDERSSAQTAAWLRRAASNHLIDWRRHNARSHTPENMSAFERTWEYTVAGDDSDLWIAALRACMDELDERSRSALEHRYCAELGRDESARLLDTSEKAVKALLQRTRERLKTCVERGMSQ